MVLAAFNPVHPSVEQIYDALTETHWEALAFQASRHVATRAPSEETIAGLRDMGLLFPSGLPTAAGYAILLEWHRRHRPARFPWNVLDCLTSPTSTHVRRMRLLWGCC